ncbi:putative NADPH-dependent methylglyoxal reductase GRE2 [Durotheca rogersii]|uniref:putative NADPH-dependent methylglyoxal reductase GRE2 n=1 Tax=Durotheca rogersii TaxID=419775 RepID=UPI00221FE138|nr:putative NADPH-dependent methylglyoxal reductase GRE2 [Durotheca rogersii]KAI5860849.1 putative NADPH-dependent methylglyoxal reductase GRE2 [Durotheca rogersii]
MAKSHRILLTGANGYIAQHILWQLLEEGYSVRAVARSESKIEPLRKTFGKWLGTPQLDFGVVPDIAIPGAFDAVLQSDPPFDIVIHTASPFKLNPEAGSFFLDPAIKGTTGILSDIARVAPSVRRVVITSSFAAIADFLGPPISNPAKVYTRDDWNPITLEAALATDNVMATYPASKKFAEKAAWDFVKEGKGNFELATVNPPGVYGPVLDPSQIAKPEDLNQSTVLIYDGLLKPGLKPSDPVPSTYINLYVDVRDCARAHVLAATLPEAAGKRWFTCAGELTYQGMANYLREALPEKRDVIPIGDPENTGMPEGWFQGSSPEIEEVLGLKFRPAEETIKDLGPQLVDIEKRAAAAASATA